MNGEIHALPDEPRLSTGGPHPLVEQALEVIHLLPEDSEERKLLLCQCAASLRGALTYMAVLTITKDAEEK